MKKKSKVIVFILLLFGLNLNAQSKLNYVKQKVGERLSEYVPIKFDYSVASNSYIDRMSGIKKEERSSLVSYQISDVSSLPGGKLKIKGTFVIDKTDCYKTTITKRISNVSFKFEAIAKPILDDFEIVKVMYFDDKIMYTEEWRVLFNNED